VRLAGVDAGGKGVQPLDAVGKAVVHQKLQRAIGDGGLVAETIGGKTRQHVIGTKRLVLLQQDLQHPAADRGQADPGGGGHLRGAGKGVSGAMGMVMHRKGQIGGGATGAVGVVVLVGHLGGLTCYDITYISRSKKSGVIMRYIITFAIASATPAFAEVPKVVTDIPPVHALVAEVMGDLGSPELLLAKGADEHDFQLRPSQAGAVAGADLVVWIGAELTPWLDAAMGNRPEGAAALGLLDAEGTFLRAYGEAAGNEHDHSAKGHDDHGHDDHGHEEEGHDDHAHDGTDPHVWLDPANGKHWLGLIAADLSKLDPDNAATYAANAAAASDRIDTLDRDLAALLAPVKDKPIVTFHDAYGYFGGHYGLNFADSIALGDAAAPGAKRLQELRAKMEAGEALCIFPEAQHDPALVQQMAEGTGAKVGAALDPVGSSLEPGPGAYAALLTGMAQAIAECLAD